MMPTTHRQARRQITALFEHGDDTKGAAAVLSHVRDCAACSRLYNRYARLEVALARSRVEEPHTFAVERIEAAVLAAVGTPTPRREPWWTFAGVLAPLGVAMVLLFVAVVPRAPSADRRAIPLGSVLASPSLDERFVARGSTFAAAANVGVRLFAVVQETEAAREAHELRLDDMVTFSYTNLEPDLRYLTLFGMQNGAVRWYSPTYDRTESVRIATDVVDEPLGYGVALRVNHEAGDLTVVAIFSAKPLSVAKITKLSAQGVGFEAVADALQSAENRLLSHAFRLQVQEP